MEVSKRKEWRAAEVTGCGLRGSRRAGGGGQRDPPGLRRQWAACLRRSVRGQRGARGAEGRGEFPVLAKWSPARSCASAFSPGPAVPDTCRVRSGSPPPSKSRLFSQFSSAASASFICGARSSRGGVPRERRTRGLRRRPGMLQPPSAPRPAPGPGREAPPPGGPAQRRRRRWQSCWHGCDPSFVSCPIPEPGQAGEGAGVGKERKPLYGSWPHLLPPPQILRDFSLPRTRAQVSAYAPLLGQLDSGGQRPDHHAAPSFGFLLRYSIFNSGC